MDIVVYRLCEWGRAVDTGHLDWPTVGTMPLGTVSVCVCVNRMSEWWTRLEEDCV